MLKPTITVLAAALVVLAAGCGGDDEPERGQTTTSPAVGTAPTAPEPRPGAESKPETESRQETADGGGRKRPANNPVVKRDQGTKPVGKLSVNEREFSVIPSQQALLVEGVWTVTVINRGRITHALDIEGPNGETEVGEIAPRQKRTVRAYLVKGDYELYCPIGDHAARGMRAKLPVG